MNENNSPHKRLESIDAFRGATIAGMIIVINPGSWKFIYPPLRHANWHGWTITDLIYPFFLFIVGAAIVFSFSKNIEKNIDNKSLYAKIIRRTIILFGLGLFINTFPNFNLPNIRIMGVLQRIAICYMIVSVIVINTKLYTQLIIALVLIFVYWAAMEWLPIPGLGSDPYAKFTNAATYFDKLILSGHMGSYEKLGEPEGFLSTLPSISTTLFGVLTGHFLKSNVTVNKKAVNLFLTGILCVMLGMLWSIWLPINKHLWTSSYAVLTAGYALICLSIFYYLIDVKGYKKWAKPLFVFGMNAITAYVLSIVFAKLIMLIKIESPNGITYHLKAWVYENFFSMLFGNYTGSAIQALTYCLIWCSIMWFLYNKRIFIKV